MAQELHLHRSPACPPGSHRSQQRRLLPSQPGTGQHSCCFRHAAPRCHGHTPVAVWVGSTGPLCQKDTRTLQLFAFSWSWNGRDAPALPLLTVTIPLYLQVPRETRGEIPPEPSQQQKFSCQPRAKVTFLLLHEAP